MLKRYKVACTIAVLAVPTLSLLRSVALPRVVAGQTGGTLNTVLLALTAAILAVLLLLCAGKSEVTNVVTGRGVKPVVAGCLFTGFGMIVSAVSDWNNWKNHKVLPYPAKTITTQADSILFYALVGLGIVAGLFFLLIAWRWSGAKYTQRKQLRLLALVPVIWIWVRIARFELSYVSSLSVYRGVYDLLMLVFEMLFFLWFARFVSGVEQEMPRFLMGSAWGVGVLSISSCVTRVVMMLVRNQVAFDSCGLIGAADLGVAVLAFAFAFGQTFSAKGEEESESVAEDTEETEGDLFDDARRVQQMLEEPALKADEDDFDGPEVPRKPIELEELISDLMLQYQEEE